RADRRPLRPGGAGRARRRPSEPARRVDRSRARRRTPSRRHGTAGPRGRRARAAYAPRRAGLRAPAVMRAATASSCRRDARWVAATFVAVALALAIAGNPGGACAGTFIFAGDANGVDVVTHPPGYGGSGGTVNVTVCIDPTSTNATSMVQSVQN